jgi:hypothetical protein
MVEPTIQILYNHFQSEADENENDLLYPLLASFPIRMFQRT